MVNRNDCTSKVTEYATTARDMRGHYGGTVDSNAIIPIPPAGDGWAMCGSAVHSDQVLWFWQRERWVADVERIWPNAPVAPLPPDHKVLELSAAGAAHVDELTEAEVNDLAGHAVGAGALGKSLASRNEWASIARAVVARYRELRPAPLIDKPDEARDALVQAAVGVQEYEPLEVDFRTLRAASEWIAFHKARRAYLRKGKSIIDPDPLAELERIVALLRQKP